MEDLEPEWEIDNEASVKRRISSYATGNNARIYIGITNDPDERADDHATNWRDQGWLRRVFGGRRPPSRMIVLRESHTDDFRAEEQDLIDFYRNHPNIVITNVGDGGEGRPSTGPYYLYILLE